MIYGGVNSIRDRYCVWSLRIGISSLTVQYRGDRFTVGYEWVGVVWGGLSGSNYSTGVM